MPRQILTHVLELISHVFELARNVRESCDSHSPITVQKLTPLCITAILLRVQPL